MFFLRKNYFRVKYCRIAWREFELKSHVMELNDRPPPPPSNIEWVKAKHRLPVDILRSASLQLWKACSFVEFSLSHVIALSPLLLNVHYTGFPPPPPSFRCKWRMSWRLMNVNPAYAMAFENFAIFALVIATWGSFKYDRWTTTTTTSHCNFLRHEKHKIGGVEYSETE